MGKSIRSKIKRKFRAIKRVKNADFETNRIKERYVKLHVRLGKSEEEVRSKLATDMAESDKIRTAEKLDVEERRKLMGKETLAKIKAGDSDMTMEDDGTTLEDMGVDDMNPMGVNMTSARRNGPRGKGAKGSNKKSLKKGTKGKSHKRKPDGLQKLLSQAARGGPLKKLTTNKARNRRNNPGR